MSGNTIIYKDLHIYHQNTKNLLFFNMSSSTEHIAFKLKHHTSHCTHKSQTFGCVVYLCIFLSQSSNKYFNNIIILWLVLSHRDAANRYSSTLNKFAENYNLTTVAGNYYLSQSDGNDVQNAMGTMFPWGSMLTPTIT